MNNTTYSQLISLLRFPLICAVVCIHCDIRVSCPWTEDLSFFPAFMYLFIDTLCVIAVPSFFFISGFLFFHNGEFSRTAYFEKLKRRISSLLIPYLLWNIIYFLIVALLQMLIPSFQLLLHKPVSDMAPVDFIWMFWDISKVTHLTTDQAAPLVTQFWFLQCLMVITVLTPLVWYCIKKTGLFFVVAIGIIYALDILPPYPGLHISTLFYYSLGAFFSIKHYSVSLFVTKHWRLMAVLFAVAMTLSTITAQPWNTFPSIVSTMLLMLLAFSLAAWLARKGYRLPAILTGSVFFVFAIHRLFSAIMTNVARSEFIATNTDISAFIYFVVGTLVVIVVSIASFSAMKKVSKKGSLWLTGKRT